MRRADSPLKGDIEWRKRINSEMFDCFPLFNLKCLYIQDFVSQNQCKMFFNIYSYIETNHFINENIQGDRTQM